MSEGPPVSFDFSDLEALSVLANYRRWIVDAFEPFLGGHVVEFGAGIGSLSAEVARHCDRLHLVEPLASLFSRLQSRFGASSNISFQNVDFEHCVQSCTDGTYDGAVMINVLEHIADDRSALRELYRILKVGGHILIFVPALSFLFSDYDRLQGHYRRYHMDDLCRHVTDAGFVLRQSRYFDMIGILPWLISMRLLRQTRIRSGMAEIYDRLVVPVGRAIESVARPPIGKNILLVATKY